ncbi:maleylpyruvate isomerase family mycothiol-dependent enzyme [Amycolatopsis anabasis]|uniref:maleylpyruvate isomerase family mycothiol-dependent enzyme n=1 Tax=Amycolatopsis anabasis TaxID=1840409 RepID=UPI00131CD00D|nr:maleylpyruvate isomerase family mycothiol-dependent enzyme [Amycolatopsis anabasis]
MPDRRWQAWVDAGTETVLRTLDGLAVGEPSLLPGWSRAHVLAHLARNADALGNLLAWARTGVETPMYRDQARRDADIEAGARQPAAELFADVRDSAARLAEAIATLPSEAWAARVRTAQGRDIPASDVLWLRSREVWIHAVDLDARVGFAALPGDFVDALFTEAAASIGRNPGCPGVELRPDDRGAKWTVGAGAPIAVTGSAADLLGWLLGRTVTGVRTGAAQLPTLPAWL